MTIKPIKQWRRVLLDTTVIMDFVKDPEKFAKNPPEQQRIINTKNLLAYLSPAAPPSENEPPKVTLLISAVSISELLSMPGSGSNIQKIVSLFSGSNALAERKLDAVVSADKGVFKTIAGKMGLPYVNTELLPRDMFGEIDVDNSF
jgi:hypothetical protein